MTAKNELHTLLADCKELAKQGLEEGELITHLHKHRATITESIKVVMEAYQMPLSDAKHLVSAHPLWKDVVAAAVPLHNELEQELRNDSKEK